jgi:hypothetical protein
MLAEHLPDAARVGCVAGAGDVPGEQAVRPGEDQRAAAARRQVLQNREQLDGALARAGPERDEVVVPRAADRQGPAFVRGREGDQRAAPPAGWLPAAGAEDGVEASRMAGLPRARNSGVSVTARRPAGCCTVQLSRRSRTIPWRRPRCSQIRSTMAAASAAGIAPGSRNNPVSRISRT